MGNQMGNFAEKFSLKYEFVEYQPKTKFGPIKIYRKKEPSYDYVMVVQRLINEEEIPRYKEELTYIHNSFKQPQQPMLLKLYGYQICQEGLNTCTKKCRIKFYLEYLNFTFSSLINDRNDKQQEFTTEQVFYVLYNTIKIYHFCQKLKISHLSARTDSIHLSLQGQLRFSPIQLAIDNFSQEIQCNNLNNCKPIPIKKKYKINDKLLVYEIKKLFSEMVPLKNKNNFYNVYLFKLHKSINACNSISDIQKIVQMPKIENLQFNPKKINFSQAQTSAKRTKQSPLQTNSQFSKTSFQTKISVRNVKKQVKSNRPFSYQTEHF